MCLDIDRAIELMTPEQLKELWDAWERYFEGMRALASPELAQFDGGTILRTPFIYENKED